MEQAKRVVLKLSGEALAGEKKTGFDETTVVGVAKQIKVFCKTDEKTSDFLKLAAQKFQLSGRKYSRILKLARTIADLNSKENITLEHVTQALQYREG